MNINLMKGDCLERMKEIPDKSVDMVLTDPPYGTTACKWDSVIDFKLMWAELKRITKDNGAIALFGSEPFSSALRMSNIKEFKYDWVWKKNKASNFLNAKHQPMRAHEIVSVFYAKRANFFPIPFRDGYAEKRSMTCNGRATENFGSFKPLNNGTKKITSAISVIDFSIVHAQSKEYSGHSTQKPVALLEYLIKTYTLENETVLDFTMGSGSTGVACKNLNRNFIGIERDDKYFEIAKNRIENS